MTPAIFGHLCCYRTSKTVSDMLVETNRKSFRVFWWESTPRYLGSPYQCCRAVSLRQLSFQLLLWQIMWPSFFEHKCPKRKLKRLIITINVVIDHQVAMQQKIRARGLSWVWVSCPWPAGSALAVLRHCVTYFFIIICKRTRREVVAAGW